MVGQILRGDGTDADPGKIHRLHAVENMSLAHNHASRRRNSALTDGYVALLLAMTLRRCRAQRGHSCDEMEPWGLDHPALPECLQCRWHQPELPRKDLRVVFTDARCGSV